MKFDTFSLLIAFLLMLGLFCVEAKRPNVLFILVDDMGARDLSNEGSAFYESPHIDRIAHEGMKFTRGYATCQVCSPSRASILTGKYPPNHGITTWIGDASGEAWRRRGRHDSHFPPEYERNLRASEITLAEAMKSAGYTTFLPENGTLVPKGSWPTDHGFDLNKGGWDVGSPRGGFFSPWQNPNLAPGPAGESLTLRLGQETADFIEANKNQPFLAYLSFFTPSTDQSRPPRHCGRNTATRPKKSGWPRNVFFSIGVSMSGRYRTVRSMPG